MACFVFPADPSPGQEVQVVNRLYYWDAVNEVWRLRYFLWPPLDDKNYVAENGAWVENNAGGCLFDPINFQAPIFTVQEVIEFIDTQLLLRQVKQGGITANRPSPADAYEYYFDTTLGKPIWYDGTQWVDATGAAV